MIFYHDEEQRRLATESRDRIAAKTGKGVYTEIIPFSEFYLAEAYHQKYRLQLDRQLMKEFRAMYPDMRAKAPEDCAVVQIVRNG